MFEDLKNGLTELQVVQERYDKDLWDIKSPSLAVFRHISHHLHITCGKLSRITEPREHLANKNPETFHNDFSQDERDIIEPCIADLILHAAQLANLLSFDLSDTYLQRCKTNSVRFAPDSEFAHEMKDYEHED